MAALLANPFFIMLIAVMPRTTCGSARETRQTGFEERALEKQCTANGMRGLGGGLRTFFSFCFAADSFSFDIVPDSAALDASEIIQGWPSACSADGRVAGSVFNKKLMKDFAFCDTVSHHGDGNSYLPDVICCTRAGVLSS